MTGTTLPVMTRAAAIVLMKLAVSRRRSFLAILFPELKALSMSSIDRALCFRRSEPTRAIGLARQGEPWTSRSAVVENDDWMVVPASRREAEGSPPSYPVETKIRPARIGLLVAAQALILVEDKGPHRDPRLAAISQ